MKFKIGDKIKYIVKHSNYNNLEGEITNITNTNTYWVTLYRKDGSVAIKGTTYESSLQPLITMNRNGANS